MQILQLPSDTQVPGPSQIANAFNTDKGVSQALLQYRQSDATIKPGNLLTLPVGNSLLYVQPVYIQRSAIEGSYPVLQFVIASFGGDVGFGTTLDEALRVALGLAEGTTPDDGGTPTTSPTPGDTKTASQLLADASKYYDQAQDALKKGDLATYQQRINQMGTAIDAARKLVDAPKK